MLNSKLQQILSDRRKSVPLEVSAQEWAARQELAACYRLCVHYKWTDMIYNHISLRVPGNDNQFLINAFGLLYEEVSASNLVKVDVNGMPVNTDEELEVQPAGFVIHAAIHKARPDLHCVFHTHTRATVAVASQKRGLRFTSQQAMRFFNRIGYHDYEGISLDEDEQQRLVTDLGSYKSMILRNHGMITAGDSVHAAFEEMYYLEMACQIQIDAMSGGEELIEPPAEVCEHAARQFEKVQKFIKGRDWDALRRMLDRKDPSYLE